MYHHLDDRSRALLKRQMLRWQGHLLTTYGTVENIPIGPEGVYNGLEEAISYLDAPQANETDHRIIATAGDGYHLRHPAGCFHVQYFYKLVWHVAEHPTGRLWKVEPQDGTGTNYWISQRGQETPLATGNNWKEVLDTIQANYGF